MIERYSRPEMSKVWSQENKFRKMLEVELAVAGAQSELKIIPRAAYLSLRKKSKFSVARINEIEKTTKHDVIAFVSNVAENVGPHGRYLHFGMTSSDVLDTSFSLLLRDAGGILDEDLENLESALKKMSKKHAQTICSGRTHGMHAEPTSFGLKLAGHLAEFKRARVRLTRAIAQAQIGKLSGAVGTYSTQGDRVEEKVCKKLKLQAETVATQVIPRDRHAEVITALSFIGCALERLSIELRHLQRTEVAEVCEGFSSGQKGSSAMPHKKNPISAENITGIARLLRAYQMSAFENVALWHERDISHSSVERVIFPDAFIICDYAIERMQKLLSQLQVDEKRMRANIELSQGQMFSSMILLELIETGMSREDAYKKIQEVSHGLKKGEQLKSAIVKNKEISGLLKRKKIDEIFSGKLHLQYVPKLLKRAGV